jgi:hypothetical protein
VSLGCQVWLNVSRSAVNTIVWPPDPGRV